jgi:hypothetical protein
MYGIVINVCFPDDFAAAHRVARTQQLSPGTIQVEYYTSAPVSLLIIRHGTLAAEALYEASGSWEGNMQSWRGNSSLRYN